MILAKKQIEQNWWKLGPDWTKKIILGLKWKNWEK